MVNKKRYMRKVSSRLKDINTWSASLTARANERIIVIVPHFSSKGKHTLCDGDS